MDEKRLSELLKDAVADTPPPTFTQADVTRESERQRVRRRNGLLTGSAFGVVVLAGATALSVALWTGQETADQASSPEIAASSGNGNAAPYEVPEEDSRAAPKTERGDTQSFPSCGPKQGGPSTGNGGPAGPTCIPSGCEQVDRELAAALAGELPAAANIKARDAVQVTLSCGEGVKGAAFDLPDGGRISVLLVPGGSTAMSMDVGVSGVEATAYTDDGAQVRVVSEPPSPGDSVPFESDLSRLASGVAQIY